MRRGDVVFDVTRQQPAVVLRQEGPWVTLGRPGRKAWRTHVAAVRGATERERRALRALKKLVGRQRERELAAKVAEVNARSLRAWW